MSATLKCSPSSAAMEVQNRILSRVLLGKGTTIRVSASDWLERGAIRHVPAPPEPKVGQTLGVLTWDEEEESRADYLHLDPL